MSVASIKFYLREGLLPPGDTSRPHRAYYDERHVRRLSVIRAMRDADISIDAMRRAFDAVTAPRADAVDAIAPAIDALAVSTDAPADAPVDATLLEARRDVAELFRRAGLSVREEAGSRETAARALASIRRFGFDFTPEQLSLYLEMLTPLAHTEIERNESTRNMLLSDKEGSLELAVLGTVLFEPIMIAFRRALHEHFTTKLVRATTPHPATRDVAGMRTPAATKARTSRAMPSSGAKKAVKVGTKRSTSTTGRAPRSNS